MSINWRRKWNLSVILLLMHDSLFLWQTWLCGNLDHEILRCIRFRNNIVSSWRSCVRNRPWILLLSSAVVKISISWWTTRREVMGCSITACHVVICQPMYSPQFFEMLSFKGYTGWFVVFSRFSYFASTRSKEFIYQRLFISFYKVITQVHTDWYEIHDLSKNRQIVAEENLRNTSCQAGRCFRILIIG